MTEIRELYKMKRRADQERNQTKDGGMKERERPEGIRQGATSASGAAGFPTLQIPSTASFAAWTMRDPAD